MGLKENAGDEFDKFRVLNQLGQDTLCRFFCWKKLKVLYFMKNPEEIQMDVRIQKTPTVLLFLVRYMPEQDIKGLWKVCVKGQITHSKKLSLLKCINGTKNVKSDLSIHRSRFYTIFMWSDTFILYHSTVINKHCQNKHNYCYALSLHHLHKFFIVNISEKIQLDFRFFA